MAKSRKGQAIEEMLKKEIGQNRIDINISKYGRMVGPLPRIQSLKNNSALKTFAVHNGYELYVEQPKIYLLKK